VRNVARIKLGYYPLPPAEGARLRSLLTFAPGASALDPCAGTGAALHQLTVGAEVEKHAVELDGERVAVAAASGIATVHGNLFDTVGRVESFSFLYLNPPFDSEIGSMGNKRMEYRSEHAVLVLGKIVPDKRRLVNVYQVAEALQEDIPQFWLHWGSVVSPQQAVFGVLVCHRRSPFLTHGAWRRG
jgi:predicted RNA methylase